MKNFLIKVKDAVKKITDKVLGFLLTDKGDELLEKYSDIAVKITARIKLIVESPVMDIAVDVIPGDVDRMLLDKARDIVPKVAFKVGLVHKIVVESENPSTAIDGIIAYLKTLNPEARAGFWITFAGELNIALSDGKITLSEAVILTQSAYLGLFGKI